MTSVLLIPDNAASLSVDLARVPIRDEVVCVPTEKEDDRYHVLRVLLVADASARVICTKINATR